MPKNVIVFFFGGLFLPKRMYMDTTKCDGLFQVSQRENIWLRQSSHDF